jgi:hypothetical protein
MVVLNFIVIEIFFALFCGILVIILFYLELFFFVNLGSQILPLKKNYVEFSCY